MDFPTHINLYITQAKLHSIELGSSLGMLTRDLKN